MREEEEEEDEDEDDDDEERREGSTRSREHQSWRASMKERKTEMTELRACSLMWIV